MAEAMDPIHQFNIEPIVKLHPFGVDTSFTNASLFMAFIVLAASALMIYARRRVRSSGPASIHGRDEL